MKKLIVTSSATLLLAATSVVAAPAKPSISMQTARAKALRLVPNGKIQAGELETENGKLVYSFDIVVRGRSGVEEVQISALNGALVSRTHESPADEEAEGKAEAKERKGQ